MNDNIHEHAHESKDSNNINKNLNNNNIDKKKVIITSKTTKNEINNLINSKNH